MRKETLNKPEIEKKNELESVFELINKEKLDKDYTFRLNNERDFDGEKIPGQAFWIKIKDEDKCVEAKLYQPDNNSKSLALFAPGMPGDGTTWFEEKHVKKLIENGYAIITIRHNGTKLDGEKSNDYIHSEERIRKGIDTGQKNLGVQKKYTIKETAEEYEIVLKLLADKFNDIKLIGHSSGVFNLAHSLTNLAPEVTNKIKSFIGLSGFIGGYDVEKNIFDPEGRFNSEGLKDYYEYCNTALNLEKPEKSVEEAKGMFERIYDHKLPENINYIQVTSDKDEYIPLSTAKKFQEHVGGLRITDKTQFEENFHSLKNLRSETLIRLLNIDNPKSIHSVEFNRREPMEKI